MAETIDTLELKVQSDAERAASGLDDLANILSRLKTAVEGSQSELGKLSAGLKSVSSETDMKKSMSGLENQIDRYSRQMADDLAKAFDINDKDALLDIKNLSKEFAELMKSGNEGKALDDNMQGFVNAIQSGSRETRVFDDEMQKFYQTVKSVSKIKISPQDMKDLYHSEDWKYMDGLLRQKMSTKEGTDLDSLMPEWREQFRGIFNEDIDKQFNLNTVQGQFQALNDIIRQCREGIVITDRNSITNETIWDEVTQAVGNTLAKIHELQKAVPNAVDEESVSEKVSELKARFKDAGKDSITIPLNADDIQKELNSVLAKLDKLYGREEKEISLGKVDSKGFESLQYDIALAENRANELREKLYEVRMEAGKEVPADKISESFEAALSAMKDRAKQEAGEISAELGKMEPPHVEYVSRESLEYSKSAMKAVFGEMYSDITNCQKAMEAFGAASSTDLGRVLSNASSVDKEMQELEAKLSQLKIPPIEESSLDKLERRLQKTEEKYNELKNKLENGITMGHITESADDSGYVRLREQMQLAENEAAALKARIQEIGGANPAPEVMSLLDSIRYSFSLVANSVIEKAAEIRAGIANGIAHPFQSLAGIAGSVVNGMKSVLGQLVSVLGKVANAAMSAANVIGKTLLSGIKKSASAIGGYIKKMASSLGGLFKNVSGGGKTLKSGLKSLLKYGFGIRSLYVLFNKMRAAMKEGFENLAQYSTEVNASISSMSSALATLKNALAVAFAPIVNLVAPYISYFINLMVSAANAVGRFFAALTGKSIATQAVGVTKDFAKSVAGAGGAAKKANKELNKWIASWHEVNNMTSNDSDSGGGGGGGADMPAEDMFTDVPIESSIQDLADRMKKSWDKDADFSWLGGLVGEKLKNALDNIPWDEIQETCNKIAKSIATFLNGIIATPGLWETIGKTIGEAVSTGVGAWNTFFDTVQFENFGAGIATALNNAIQIIDPYELGRAMSQLIEAAIEIFYGFVTKFEWDKFGTWFGEVLNGFFGNIDFAKLGADLSNGFIGIFDMLTATFEKFDWTGLGDKFNQLFYNIDFAEAASSLSESIIGFFNGLTALLEEVDWHGLGERIREFFVNIDWAGIAQSVFTALGTAFAGLGELIRGLFEEAWGSVISWWKDTAGEDGKMTIGEFLNGIKDVMADIGGWLMENVIDPFMNAFVGEDTWSGMKDAAKDMWDGFTQGIRDFFSDPLGFIKEHIVDPFIRGFKELFGIASPSTVMEEQGGFLMEGLKNGIDSWIPDIGDAFGKIKDAIGEKWDAVKEKTSEVWDNITSAVSGKWNEIKSLASEKFSETKESVEEAWGKIKTSTSETWSNVKDTISTLISGAKDNAETAWNGIKSGLTDSWNNIKSETGTSWENIKNTVCSVMQEMWESSDENGKNMTNVLTNAFSDIWESAKTNFENVKESLSNLWESVKEKAGKIGSKLKEAFSGSPVLYNPDSSAKRPLIPSPALQGAGNENVDLISDILPLADISDGVDRVASQIGAYSADYSLPISGYRMSNSAMGQNGSTSAKVTSDEKNAEYIFEMRQIRESNERVIEVLEQILAKGIVLDDNTFERKYKSTASAYRRRTGAQMGVAY